MSSLARFPLDLTTDELDSMERWSAMAGFRTKTEFVLNAFTMFRWAAQQVLLGRTICAVNEATGEIRHLEMPALAAIASWGTPPPLSAEERYLRIAEPGRPLPEHFFQSGGEHDVAAARSLDPRGVERPESNLGNAPQAP
ncbi:MAG: hypothetical protein P4L84_23215 [Isosphaeraceae bacterium]|nr:hypothetical protein [Isosphaeraceae bacterium]